MIIGAIRSQVKIYPHTTINIGLFHYNTADNADYHKVYMQKTKQISIINRRTFYKVPVLIAFILFVDLIYVIFLFYNINNEYKYKLSTLWSTAVTRKSLLQKSLRTHSLNGIQNQPITEWEILFHSHQT